MVVLTTGCNKKINENEDWYIEVQNEYINVRQDANQYSEKLGTVEKNDKYLVLEIKKDANYVWYKIKYNKKEGWIANPKRNHNYLTDYNNPEDVYNPTLKFKTDIYNTVSMDTINYDKLEVWDDKEYNLTHEVYKEITKDGDIQYWIKWTIIDKVGNKDSKLQRIVFEIEPKENEVRKFEEI